jgi:Zn-dependent peptidase ImmA (M78 family)
VNNVTELTLEKQALAFRKDNGLNSTDPVRLKSLVQKVNVITSFGALADNFSGMAIKANGTDRFMLINNKQSLGKQHFTICHELYHLFIQENFTSQVCNTGLFNKKDKIEYNADVFASHLLLPTEGILSNIPDEEINNKKISLKTILFIEHFYSCSRKALLYRLKKLGVIDAAQYETFAVNVKRSALENGYSTELYEAGNINQHIGDYGSLARQLYEKEKISQSHYYTLLGDLGIDINKITDNTNEEF